MTLRTSFKSIQSRVVQQGQLCLLSSSINIVTARQAKFAITPRSFTPRVPRGRRGPTALGVAARRNSAGAPTARESWPASIALT